MESLPAERLGAKQCAGDVTHLLPSPPPCSHPTPPFTSSPLLHITTSPPLPRLPTSPLLPPHPLVLLHQPPSPPLQHPTSSHSPNFWPAPPPPLPNYPSLQGGHPLAPCSLLYSGLLDEIAPIFPPLPVLCSTRGLQRRWAAVCWRRRSSTVLLPTRATWRSYTTLGLKNRRRGRAISEGGGRGGLLTI